MNADAEDFLLDRGVPHLAQPAPGNPASVARNRSGAISNRWTAVEGAPIPLGVTYVLADRAYNFALYSKHATRVQLLLYGAQDCAIPLHAQTLDWRHNKSGRMWHCRVPVQIVEAARYYAYRVDGPHEPWNGHRFDPEKILLDPYAHAVHFPPGHSRLAAASPGDNAGRAPLGVLHISDGHANWTDNHVAGHTHDLVIYELHVRGFTKRANSGVEPNKRGTFAGLIEKIPYLRELGITAVELMPVFQADPQEGSCWGYMPLSFFALNGAYGQDDDPGQAIGEFKELVEALHRADIEVILDVVCNHTTEGDEAGPTYSFRGIDNSTYYLLEADRSRYRNDSGTGNVLHTANRYVRGMVLDCLRYWASEMHVDGFRFDLASLFTRQDDGSINLDDPPVISAIQSDPVLSRVRLIAEAWDLSSYQLGRAFPGTAWLQWNGKFRDQVRSFVRGDAWQTGNLMRRLYGSDDLFPDTCEDAFHAYQSVNFVTCHDGFSLYDLVSYNRKRNEANGHANKDGAEDDVSWNCGWEGDDGAPAEVLALRKRQAKNFLCLLLPSNGTPMLRAGDEFLNTQRGNNNPYNQDNETSWLDWDLLSRHRDVFRFAKLMIAFRKAHPSIARSRFWRGDVRWCGAQGQPPNFGDNTIAFRLHGASQGDDDVHVMVNSGPVDREFVVQAEQAVWRLVVDTARESPGDIREPGPEDRLATSSYVVQARSVIVLVSEPGGPGGTTCMESGLSQS